MKTNELNTAEECIELAESLSDNGQIQKAIEVLDMGLKMNPKNAEAYYHIAINLAELSNHQQAVTMYKKAIELKLNNPEIY